MKKEVNKIRNKFVVVRLNEQEYERIHQLFQKTTERYVSAYLRKVLLQKPVVVKYRNASADDFLKDMLQLRKQLAAASSNFQEAVNKLITLQMIPEFRSWLLLHETSKQAVEQKIQQIHQRITQLYEQWLLKLT